MAKNLFEITARLDALLNEAEENEGIIGESQAEELALSEEELGDKLYAYSFVCDRLDTDIAFLKERKQAIDDRIKRVERKKARLKDIIAQCVWAYGEDVLKKNPDTGIKEPTGSKSLKFPDISISVRKAPDVKTDTASFNIFLKCIYDYFYNNCNTESFPIAYMLDKSKAFIDVKLTKGFSIDKANEIRNILKEKGITFEEGAFEFFVNPKNLKETLIQSPEGLDAWSLEEKDIVTIKK